MNYAVYRKKPETFSFLGIQLENSHISDLVEQYTVVSSSCLSSQHYSIIGHK